MPSLTNAFSRTHFHCTFSRSLGNVYIADIVRIRMVNSAGILSNFAGSSGNWQGSTGDNGPATSALLYQAYDIINDMSGNVYISDIGNNNVRKVDSAGIITTYAGSGTTGTTGGSSGDGGPATSALMHYPDGLALDTSANLYIADTGNHVIRVVAIDTGIITTVAGTGISGSSGDGGSATAATFVHPYRLVIDVSNNMYVSDNFNERIRKLTAMYNYPTSQPSRQPSQQPSSFPTNPSSQPSQQPTRQPTRLPSMQPSRQPSTQPSIQPSGHPTQPSGQPSRQPSSQPSAQPSRQPSSQPSRKPSCQPTTQPSEQPTSIPSRPSGQPSRQPSQQPTKQPTSRPSRQPTCRPTGTHTNLFIQSISHPLSHPFLCKMDEISSQHIISLLSF